MLPRGAQRKAGEGGGGGEGACQPSGLKPAAQTQASSSVWLGGAKAGAGGREEGTVAWGGGRLRVHEGRGEGGAVRPPGVLAAVGRAAKHEARLGHVCQPHVHTPPRHTCTSQQTTLSRQPPRRPATAHCGRGKGGPPAKKGAMELHERTCVPKAAGQTTRRAAGRATRSTSQHVQLRRYGLAWPGLAWAGRGARGRTGGGGHSPSGVVTAAAKPPEREPQKPACSALTGSPAGPGSIAARILCLWHTLHCSGRLSLVSAALPPLA